MALKVSAQKNLVVYYVSGKVNIITNTKAVAAIRGKTITPQNSLEVQLGSLCMLIDATGKSVQINVAGIYFFENLQKMIQSAAENNVSTKFFKYVYENLFGGNTTDKLGVAPAVFRGEDLMRSPVNNTIVVADAVSFSWRRPVSKAAVRLVIEDLQNRILFDSVFKMKNAFQIYLSENILKPGNLCVWKVEEAGAHQQVKNYFQFIIAEKKDAKNIVKEFDLVRDKNLPEKLKQQLQQDIFNKWKMIYEHKTKTE